MLAALAVPWVRGLDIALPRLDQVSLGGRSLVFLALVTVVSSLLFGLASALRVTTVAGGESLRSRHQGSDKEDGVRLRGALVMSEVALAMVLTVGAGLLLRSFEQLHDFDSGFDTSGVLLARLDLPPERYSDGGQSPGLFFERLVEKLEVLSPHQSSRRSAVSWRRTVIGSTRPARRAGRPLATSPTTASTATTTASTWGSKGEVW